MTDFDVIAYRGALVWSRDAWVEDARARGGAGPTRVPGGFFHDAACFRFGDAAPFTYELAPAWLLVWDGIDVASDEAARVLGAAATGGDNTRIDTVIADQFPGDPSSPSGGVRPWVAAAILVAVVILYAIGVTAGIFPPARKLFRKR